MIDVEADGARLAERHVAVAYDRDFAERMDGIDRGSVWHDRNKGVGNTPLGTGDACDPDIIVCGPPMI